MHLRSLRLRGFKSFAEPVELLFEPGVSVIVGPNGSGKSNVAEALQWAMASQPPSELRLDVAVDVLFNGSTRRQPSGLCEVELVLDNEDDTVAGGRPEVSVMRRLRRDGESTYLLNRVPVRRLDVQETLADAGLGRELHAIVSQGRVEAILLSRPEDRRGFIEEAAGLGKYKRRRHRALGKLARVEANLGRARDLESELKARLRPLALQASAAERAAALVGEIDAARVELFTSQIATSRRVRARIAGDLEGASAERARVDRLLGEVAALRERTEGELTGLVGEQERASERYWALASGLDRLTGRRGAIAERLEGLHDDAGRLAGRASRLAAEAAATAEGVSRAESELEALAAQASTIADPAEDAELARLQAGVRDALDAALAARRELAETDGRSARARHEVEDAGTRATAAAARATAIEGEVQGRRVARAGLDAALKAADDAAETATARLAAAHESLAVARAGADAAREVERASRGARSETAAALQAARVRSAAAERSLSRADGLGPAVRRLRERGVTAALDLVAVPVGLEAAVAAALGWRAGEAVAAVAGEAVELLADDELSGAALLCLDRLPARRSPAAGVPLSDLVSLADGAPDGLLDGIHVVDDALELATIEHGIAVTRDGRGFDADRGQAFRVGAAGANLLSLRRERDDASEAVTVTSGVATSAELAFAGAAQALTAAEEGERATRVGVQECSRAVDEAARRSREAARLADGAARDDERSAERLAAAREEEERLRRRAGAATEELAALVERRGDLERLAVERSSAHGSLDAERGLLAERVAARRADLAMANERIDRARADRSRLAASNERLVAQAASAASRRALLASLVELLPSTLAALDAAATRVDELRAPEKARLDSLEQRAAALASALGTGAEREQALQRTAREVAASATTLEVEGAHAEERLADLVRRRREVTERSGIEPLDRVEPLPDDEESALGGRIERLERRREQLGAVNPLAKQEYDEARERHQETAVQIADLEGAVRELRKLIRELSATIAERFAETYAQVEANFGEIVDALFPGGRGRLTLVEPDPDPEASGPREPGVELEISPAGKQISRLAILSGGEKALAAIAFLFAIMLAKPSPFYVLDEVDAALDDANVERFLAVLERFRHHAQFIVITHQKRTMEAADVLYGVTMANDGISKVVSRRLPREAGERTLLLDRG